MTMRQDADAIISAAIRAAQPDEAVKRALQGASFDSGRIVLVALGKAAWQMARAAVTELKGRVETGVVITKYGHAKGALSPLSIFEAGHPVPDDNTFLATEAAISVVENLQSCDTVLLLLSGGGSALFEKPLIPKAELLSVTKQLLARGADITEMNTIRKRLSAVKGGRFAELCAPARVFSVILSDIVGDPIDMIASGVAYPDSSSCAQAVAIAEKYGLSLSEAAWSCIRCETPKSLLNVDTVVTGSVRELCVSAEKTCRALGYEPIVLTDSLTCTARDAGVFLASIAEYYRNTDRSLAFLAGGETVVRLTGSGKGGRNQEIALAAAEKLSALHDAAIFSFGSDGTDGPTDAAGGYCDEHSKRALLEKGVSIDRVLADNDAYPALEACGGLIFTGPTGTNVNDLSVLLIRR